MKGSSPNPTTVVEIPSLLGFFKIDDWNVEGKKGREHMEHQEIVACSFPTRQVFRTVS